MITETETHRTDHLTWEIDRHFYASRDPASEDVCTVCRSGNIEFRVDGDMDDAYAAIADWEAETGFQTADEIGVGTDVLYVNGQGRWAGKTFGIGMECGQAVIDVMCSDGVMRWGWTYQVTCSAGQHHIMRQSGTMDDETRRRT